MDLQPSPKLSKARALGGVGSILAVFFMAPYAPINFALGTLGFILILAALKYISEEVGDKGIFRYGLYSALTGILALATLGAMTYHYN